MYIESERMMRPVFREFYTERDVVMEERRQRTLTNPFGKLYESFMATAYLAHPYGQPTVGWMSDLEHLTVSDAREFSERYYTPSNCVISIVGDIDIERTKEMLERYFGPIPARQKQDEVATVEPEQRGKRRVEVIFDAEPIIIMGYHKPVLPHHDDYVFDVIDIILSSGRTSRLYRSLVEGGLALSAGSSTGPGNRFSNLFTISATPRSPHTTAELEEAIEREIELLAREPVSGEELARAVKKVETSFVRSLASNAGLAGRLSYFQAIAGDYRYITRYPDVIGTITQEDILDVVSRYLTPERKTVGILVREESP
jgi:predicted Zn-dependent peptidase